MTEAKIQEPPNASPSVVTRSTGFGPLSAVVLLIVTYFASQLMAGILIGLGAAVLGFDAAEALDKLESSTYVQFAYVLVVEVITLAVLWWFMRRRSISWKEIGLGRKFMTRDIAPALQVFVVYFMALIAVTTAVEALIPSLDVDQKQQLGFESAATDVQLIFVFMSLVILPAIVEEIMVRGFLYSGLRKKFKKVTAAIVASLIFGAAHLQFGLGASPLWIAAIDTTVLSLFLIYLRERTGSLWAGMLVHGLKNGLAFLFLFVFTTQ